MKKTFIFSLVLLALLLSSGPASAGHHNHPYFGVFISPPAFSFTLPPIPLVPPPIFYPPPPYYYEGYSSRGYRVWVPGYWDYQRTPYGWERAWVPGHWEWRD